MAISEALPGTDGVTTYTEEIQPGIIVSAVCTLDVDLLTTGKLYARLAVGAPGGSIFTPRYVLTEGWVGQCSPLYWHGFLSIDDLSVFAVTIAGDRTGDRLYAAVTRLTNTNIQAIGKYIQRLGIDV